jgi:prolyl oligopeptidase
VFICVNALGQSPAPTDDPFRFLEGSGEDALAFYGEQGAKARAKLDAIPGRAPLLERIRALTNASVTVSSIRLTPARAFYLKRMPGHEHAVLCMRQGVMAGSEREILDPARHDRGPRAASIAWFAPSPDGRHVAYGIAHEGSDDATLRVLVADTQRDLPGEIDRARFNSGLEWHPDGRSFYYTRYPEPAAGVPRFSNVRVYRHVLGRDRAQDEIVFAPGVGGARDVPPFARPSLHLPLESRYAYAVVRDGVRRELAVHVTEQRDLAAGRPRWHKLAGVEDEVLAIEGWKDDLYLLTKSGAPRHRILRVKGNAASLVSARVAVPQGDVVIESMALAKDAIYMRMMNGGVDRLERAHLGMLGNLKSNEYLRTPFDTAITQLVTDPRVPGAILKLEGWIEPPSVMEVDAKRGELTRMSLQPPAPVQVADLDEVRLYAPAHDGVRIPITLLYRKSTQLTGQNPTLLVAHGAFGETMTPAFDPARLAWLERGGVYAIAHVRGGGEYGETWVQGGRGAARMNTIRDFVSVAEFLVSYGFTNPKRLAIEGTGAGAIAAGGALVRRPDLFAAVVARAPLMDMLRHERMASGPPQVPEYGSASTAAGAEALRAISAYHQVLDATAYPAVLLTAGADDARLERWQPGKMAGRLQAATTSGKPVLLRVDFPAGDPRGRPRASHAEELADIYAFLLWQMGEPQFQEPVPEPPAPPPAPELMGPPAPLVVPPPPPAPETTPK